jgi:hypothetical protein
LKSQKKVNRLVLGTALAALAILSGCDKDGYKLAFSHHLHVTENGVACSDCHGKMTEGRFAAPGHTACKECHGDWIETKEIGANTCGMCHKVKDLKKLPKSEYAKPVSNAVSKVGGVFRHTDALSNRCAECHGYLMDKKLSGVPQMTRGDKIRIREHAHRSGLDCSACHVDMDPRTPPASHRQNWTRRHGALGMQPDKACGVCHREESCRECHQVTKPASHNNLWRLKTHGIQAAWDRERCLVCHQQESCDACHASTPPQSHNGDWLRRNHCNNCHPSQSTGTGCTVCHKTNLESHPNPHSAGWLKQHCNRCHEPEVQNCGACHGFTTLDAHPNPHSVGWEDRHCYACHPGTPAADQCAVCHPGGNSLLVHQSFWPPFHNRFGGSVDVSICYECHEPGSAAVRSRQVRPKAGVPR